MFRLCYHKYKFLKAKAHYFFEKEGDEMPTEITTRIYHECEKCGKLKCQEVKGDLRFLNEMKSGEKANAPTDTKHTC